MQKLTFPLATAVAAALTFAAPGAHAEDHVGGNYYVAVDTLPTVNYQGSPSDAPVSRPNPNQNRLTLLLNHGDHFHSIGTYSLSGPTAAPTVQDTNANNRVPETYAGLPPLSLLPGSGFFVGQLVSGLDTGNEYEGLTLRPVASLYTPGAPPNDPGNTLFNSSGGRWNAPLGAGALLGLELVSITGGLHVSDTQGNALFSGVSDIYNLGASDDWSFTPVFHAGANAAPGVYSAEMRLVDRSGQRGNGGRFFFDFQVTPAAIPEPGTLVLLAGLFLPGGAGVVLRRRRRRHARPAVPEVGA